MEYQVGDTVRFSVSGLGGGPFTVKVLDVYAADDIETAEDVYLVTAPEEWREIHPDMSDYLIWASEIEPGTVRMAKFDTREVW